VNEKEILARFRALQRWVAREQRRLEKTGERKSQTYLRRARLVIDTDPISFRELLRELQRLRLRTPPRSGSGR